tara:strand:- start:260 stop:370 length:111 start_codon:yes stop_codon:yes gene_type:complete
VNKKNASFEISAGIGRYLNIEDLLYGRINLAIGKRF